MSDNEICYMSATELSKNYRDKTLSPVEVIKALISRAESINSKLNAFTYTFYEEALDNAKKAEEKFLSKNDNPRLLEGIPVGIKDESGLKGKPMSNGSLLLEGTISDNDAPINGRILQEGGIVLARTATPEFSCAGYCNNLVTGITRNPWNLDFTPGGSSGGSGAALAAGMIPIATGSDIGGSIRIPASCTGVVGYKPPYGRNPEEAPFCLDFFSHVGPMARTVADNALLQNIISGPHPLDMATVRENIELPFSGGDIKGKKIAWSDDLGFFEVEASVRNNFMKTLEVLKDNGAILEKVSVPWTWETYESYINYLFYGFGAFIGDVCSGNEDKVTDYALYWIEKSKTVTPSKFAGAMNTIGEMYSFFGPMMENYHAFLCPTNALPAVKADFDHSKDKVVINGTEVEPMGGWFMTHPFNALSRLPVMSVPSGFSNNNVPTGIQIVGKSFSDKDVFNVAYVIETASNWYQANERPEI